MYDRCKYLFILFISWSFLGLFIVYFIDFNLKIKMAEIINNNRILFDVNNGTSPLNNNIGTATEENPCQVGCIDNPNARVLRLVHVSDTHLKHDSLAIPAGDVLIHSGDFFDASKSGNFLDELAELEKFFAGQPHKYKLFVAGNHEMSFCGQSVDRIRARLPSCTYLQDNAVQIEGLKFYGSPWTGKRKSPASAFTAPYPELGKYWVMIPKDTDVLITHSPPHRILDNHGGMGCPLLRELVLKQIRPMVHLFGHAHEMAQVMEKEEILFSNAAQSGPLASLPIVVDLHLPPTLLAKTKLYKQPIWKEDAAETTATMTMTPDEGTTTNGVNKKFNCTIL